MLPKRRWTHMASVCLPYALSVELRICTNSWKLPFLIILKQKILYFMQLVLMLTVVCSNRCLQKKMLLFQMRLNHASIIDGVRLCKAKRYRYANADMADLERCLQEAQAQRHRIIATDGVFSMDGNVAPLDKICELAEKYDALVMVDESHSAGVVGPTGHGVAEQFNAYGRVDIFTGTLGKAFGGAMGGFTTGKKEIIDMLRQRSRPYLFSNSVAPAIIGASLEMFKILKESDALHTKLMDNVNYFRDRMLAAGFDIKPTQSAICAVMLYDAKLSQDFAAKMQKEGIYVTGFYYPVVPKGQARIRVQLSAGHEKAHLDKAIAAFIKVGKELGVINNQI